ncbi:hypothetical protein KJZ61_02545 [Candidatus Dependentiae bacterium]|nr:hypothetical protein [Candidatus Dependentiae bacterium]
MDSLCIQNVFNTIRETPLWVWGILAYLIIIGIKATRERIVYLPQLFIIPLIFIGLKYKSFFTGYHSLIIIAIIALLIGCGLGYVLGLKTKVAIIKEKLSVQIPGTYTTLILFLVYFAIQYAFGYLCATVAILPFTLLATKSIIDSLFSGYFLGRALAYTQKFFS